MADGPHVVNLHIADHEPVRSLITGITAAWDHFGPLTAAELGGLPEPVQAGIAGLRAALGSFTGDSLPPPLPEDQPCRGPAAIEWAAPAGGYPAPLCGRLTAFYETGPRHRLIPVTALTIQVRPDSVITADVTAFAGEDGEPLGLAGLPVIRDGAYVTGVFRYEVTEMRIRRPAAG